LDRQAGITRDLLQGEFTLALFEAGDEESNVRPTGMNPVSGFDLAELIRLRGWIQSPPPGHFSSLPSHGGRG
jgi:hypothetical protein